MEHSTPRPLPLRRRAVALPALLLVVAALTGCQVGTQTSAADATGMLTPGASPAAAPHDSTTITGAHFTIGVPASFQRKDATSDTTHQTFLTKTSSVAAKPSRIVVLDYASEKTEMVGDSAALEAAKKMAGATAVQREQVSWPGSTKCVVMEWIDTTSVNGGEAVQMHWVQVGVVTTAGREILVIGGAPVADFTQDGIRAAVMSFRPKD